MEAEIKTEKLLCYTSKVPLFSDTSQPNLHCL